MKRFRLLTVLTLILSFCVSLCLLLACENPHEHSYNQEIANNEFLAREATCKQKAVYYYSCECGEKGTETFEYGDFSEHTKSQEWSKDLVYHWKTCQTEGCKKQLEKAEHVFKGSLECIVCDAIKTTKGLEYKLNEDGQSYYVADIGSAKDSDIIISPEYNNMPVTQIGSNAFADCDSIESITIPDSVTSIGYGAFSSCDSIESITIPDSVTTIGESAFNSCDSLTDITIPNSVISIGAYAFSATQYFNNENNWEDEVLYIGRHLIQAKRAISGDRTIKNGTMVIANSAFSSCNSLENITLPSSVVVIGDEAFRGCSSLQNIVIPNLVTTIGRMVFSGCSSLENIGVLEYNNAYKSVDGVLYSKDGKILIQYPLAKSASAFAIPDSVTTIGMWAFSGCSELIGVTIPESVTTIKSNAFYECINLESITIPDSVTSIEGNAFNGCTKLKSITIGDSVTSIGEKVFFDTEYYNNKNNWEDGDIYGIMYIGKYLIEANSIVGDFAIKDDTLAIADAAFIKSASMRNITIPESITRIGPRTFYSCALLESITFEGAITSIGEYSFCGCMNLKNITIPESVTSIGNEAFFGCFLLKSITIPDSVVSMGNAVFSDCTNLESITIGDSLSAIKSYSFFGCAKLKSITIGDSVVSIGNYAFRDCSSLKSVFYAGTADDWREIVIGINNDDLTSASLYYYSESEPTDEGNYWHYVDGEATVWNSEDE
ncbi:MAG: leucine-rich repeat domain-containing protein [Clostridiales bacterium]|nr:leucine-rich repeat domain-containing protein [Clostridiales bacterium]